MIKTLRPYQAEVVTEIRRLLKESDEPILVNASVGAGKSLIIAEILLLVEKAGFRALCLTLNSSLIQQNANAYKLQGGSPGIYCAGLNSKATEDLVIFASPHSVCQGIRNANDISKQPFQLVIIDECHNIAPHNKASMYMRILNHYSLMAQSEQYRFKIIGLTGTPYRGKSESIVGREQLFKKEACAITTSWLIEQGFLTPPKFGITKADGFDFSSLRIQKTGKFDSKQLAEIVDSNERLTGQIMRELVVLAKNRKGVFIFASTVNHCHECAKSLPPGEWAIITGETPHEERKKTLEAARQGNLRYLINVNVLAVGVDIPAFDVCAWLRPTESLVLYTQGIGRVLRLHPKKKNALILDYAGNLDRHGDIDDPLINAALSSEFNDEKDYVINCYSCETLNTVTARRCIGTKDGKRCDHYFEFVECHLCKAKNDIAARNCRICGGEIIDPNSKLQAQAICLRKYTYQVLKATSFIRKLPSGHPLFQVTYTAVEESQPKDSFVTETIHETYALKTKKGRDIFYHE